jgi:energy-coupling factor transporter ATP-binding protein EcfA2/energy-coupling factor transporter transmembrane protein EcfT
MTPLLLEARNFHCSTKQGAALFPPLNFSLQPGEAILVEGGSGTGKSSLLFGIRGIPISDRTFQGDILFNGEPVSQTDRRSMGLVLQNPHSQALSTMVKEELGAEAEEEIEILGLGNLLDAPVRALSAGQKHLVSIAAAGKGTFPIILMDEPFLYLDQRNAERALCYIDHLRARGKGIIVSSHPGVAPVESFTTVLAMESQGFPRNEDYQEKKEHGERQENGALLEIENADIGYAGYPPIIRNLTLTLKSGEELWVYGSNGSGKTTLLKALSGEEQLVMRGSVQTICPGGKKPYIITQNPDRFFFEPTLLREMTAPVLYREDDPKKCREAEGVAVRMLGLFGLGNKKEISPPQLSFGERLRLAAAQAALLKPDFILIDDVPAFLGEAERLFFLDILRRIKNAVGSGLLFATSQEIPSLMNGQRVVCINGAGMGARKDVNSEEFCKTRLDKKQLLDLRTSRSPKSGKRRILRWFRRAPFEYVPSVTLVHRIPAGIKLIINIMLWGAVMLSKPALYPHIAALGLIYYLGGGLGVKRLFADMKYFILQAFFFCIILPVFRWDKGAWKTGLLYGVRVWLFFLPMAVMMRTTTTDEWMALFSRILSAPKRIILGISMGLFPVIVSELNDVLFVQRQKGFVLAGRDLLKPRRVWRYLKAILVPMVIITEDLARMAEVSVILDERKNKYFPKGE